MNLNAEIAIDIDDIADMVREVIESGSLADDIADRVKEDLNYDDLADAVVGSYQFDDTVQNAVNNALGDFDADEVLGKVEALVERIATLEAALAAAGKAMAEPARRVLHGVEVSATTTDLF